MPKGEEYRQHAADCVRLAQLLDHPNEKAALLRMAEIWRKLADKSDVLAAKSGVQGGVEDQANAQDHAQAQRNYANGHSAPRTEIKPSNGG
jgi:hypothetical protein